MLPFQQILSQLGFALINSLWQMALLLGVYILITSVFKFSAAARYRWAILLNFTGIVWFLATFFLPDPQPLWISSVVPLADFAHTNAVPGFVLYALSCGYLICLGYSILLLGVSFKESESTRVIINQKVPARWRLFVEQHIALLDIRRRVRMHISSNVSPATFGWIKPIILLPASCLTQLSTSQMEALLLHELAHIRRYDYLILCLLRIAEKLLFFNPFLRKLVNEARAECEHACDDLVLQFNYPAVEYSGALLAIAKESLQSTRVLMATGNQSNLLYGRICRMLQLPIAGHKLSSKNILTFLALPIVAFIISLPRPSTKNIPVKKETGTLVYWKKTPLSKNELSWQHKLFDARMNLFASAIGRTEDMKAEITAASIKSNRAEINKKVALMHKAKAEIIKSELEKQSLLEHGSMVISASWAEQQDTENKGEELTSLGWKPMQVLLDKLEVDRKLNEEEWEKLAGLITVHNEIRMAIKNDASRNLAECVTNAYIAEETSKEPEVLVIVYDEKTGTLAASVVPRSQLHSDVQLENNLTPDERQVILLRKKVEGKSKIISL